MKKNNLVLLLVCINAILVPGYSSGFSIHKPMVIAEHCVSVTASDLVKLSAKQFTEITGTKMNTWSKLSFAIAKMKLKHELKNNPGLRLTGFTYRKKKSSVWRILEWVLIGLLVFFFLLLAIAGGFH
jgi:galactitol-specific phosphotransferase system IIC component